MIIKTADELIAYGRKLGQKLKLPAVIELVGDVGAGKTTLTRGLAEGLGATEAVTSPSFNIVKRYRFPLRDEATVTSTNSGDATVAPKMGLLAHYDFYRLPDPGIMYEELAETLADPHTVVVLEWGKSVADLLPAGHLRIEIKINDDNTRTLTITEKIS